MENSTDPPSLPTTRYVCGVEYDGTDYCGWQRQTHARSVQEEVETALSKVANHPVAIICAGRTDSSVHATSQVIHFDSGANRPDQSWILGANANLCAETRLQWVRPIDHEFHARFSATARRYRYVILNRRVASALLRKRVTRAHLPLDEERMQQAAAHLVGQHDFSSYRALACQAHSPVRTIHELSVQRSGDFFYIDVRANAFLHHMVRNIAGVLMSIGRGEHSPGWAGELLDAQDRTAGGVTAPGTGLYLVGVEYPEQYDLPSTGYMPVFG